MKKTKRIIWTAIAAALAFTMCVPMKAAAYILSSDQKRSYSSVTIIEDKAYDGSITYTNRANGKTYKVYEDGRKEGDPNYKYYCVESLDRYMVRIDGNETFEIRMPYNQKLGNLKITKGKKNLAAKVCFEHVVTNYQEHIRKDKDGRYYYEDYRTNEKIYVYDADADIRTNRAVYKVRLFGKKKGKAKIEFPIEDFNGTKIGTKVINIDVTDDSRPIIKFTFAGKDVLLNTHKPGKYIGSGAGKNDREYVTSKKGRIRIKPNKYYTIQAIYVKKAAGFVKTPFQENGVTGTRMVRSGNGVDLNGDGDCNDVIYGISENEKGCTYEKVRNGQVVKLSDVPGTLEDAQGTLDRNGRGPNYEYYENNKSNMATTVFYIIYRDKRDGSYNTSIYSIQRRLTK